VAAATPALHRRGSHCARAVLAPGGCKLAHEHEQFRQFSIDACDANEHDSVAGLHLRVKKPERAALKATGPQPLHSAALQTL